MKKENKGQARNGNTGCQREKNTSLERVDRLPACGTIAYANGFFPAP
jgi:hypothetical protein